MKKNILSFAFILMSLVTFAQDENSAAYRSGYLIGRGIGFLLIAFLVGWGIWRLTRGKKK